MGGEDRTTGMDIDKAHTENENGGVLTDYFHSRSNFEEKISDDKSQAVVDKPLELIPVDDFLTLTEHEDSMPRIDLTVSIEAVEDLQHEYVMVEDDFHEHNSNDPISDILNLDDSTKAAALSVSQESASSATKEARENYSVSSNEQNFLSELENPNSLNEALDDMFRQIEDSPDIAATSSVSQESASSATKEAPKDYSASIIEQNFLSELENLNSLNEALDVMFRQIEDSPDVPLREAQDRTDVIAFDDDDDDDDDWEKKLVGDQVTTGLNNDEKYNSAPSSDGYAEEQSSDFLSEFFDFFG